MSTVKDVVKALRMVGAKCRKKPKEDEYVCYLEGKGSVEVIVNPEKTTLKLITDSEPLIDYVRFESGEYDAWNVFKEIEERLGARKVDVITERIGKGGGYSVDRFIIVFDTESANPEKIGRIAKNIADKYIWVDIRYSGVVKLKKGKKLFESDIDFVEELLGGE